MNPRRLRCFARSRDRAGGVLCEDEPRRVGRSRHPERAKDRVRFIVDQGQRLVPRAGPGEHRGELGPIRGGDRRAKLRDRHDRRLDDGRRRSGRRWCRRRARRLAKATHCPGSVSGRRRPALTRMATSRPTETWLEVAPNPSSPFADRHRDADGEQPGDDQEREAIYRGTPHRRHSARVTARCQSDRGQKDAPSGRADGA